VAELILIRRVAHRLCLVMMSLFWELIVVGMFI